MPNKAPERSTFGIKITMRDSDGELILVGAITAFLCEVHASKPGASNPIVSVSTLPTSNPFVVPLDLEALDQDTTGRVVYIEHKITYTSTELGAGIVMRSDPFEVDLTDSRIAT